MYFYLYDAFLRDKKYETTIARIEGRLLDLGMMGKSEKLTILKSMKEVVNSAIKKGADTIIAVGDDQTLSKLMSIVAENNVLVGYIPMGDKTRVAEALGIPKGVKACDVLSTRIIEKLDLGKANGTYFLSFLAIAPGKELLIECNDSYHVEPQDGAHAVTVYNFGREGNNPRDGMLEAFIEETENTGSKRWFGKTKKNVTILPITTMRIKSLGPTLMAYADGQTVVKTPIIIQVVPKKIRIIVGKERLFA